jgi:hypothetical protein
VLYAPACLGLRSIGDLGAPAARSRSRFAACWEALDRQAATPRFSAMNHPSGPEPAGQRQGRGLRVQRDEREAEQRRFRGRSLRPRMPHPPVTTGPAVAGRWRAGHASSIHCHAARGVRLRACPRCCSRSQNPCNAAGRRDGSNGRSWYWQYTPTRRTIPGHRRCGQPHRGARPAAPSRRALMVRRRPNCRSGGALRGVSCLGAISLDHGSCPKPPASAASSRSPPTRPPVRTAQPAKASASSSNIRFATSIADIARGQPA